MSDGGLTIFDGTQLRSVDLTPPNVDGGVTGARLLVIAESKVSEALSGLALPPHLKEAAISRVSAGDDVTFRVTEFDQQQAGNKLGEYVSAVADALKADPIVVSILDGSTLRLFLEDEDDFAMLAENLFTGLDVEDKGKLRKSEIRKALVHMGVGMGVPALSEFPILDSIIKNHGADGDDELGQAQFAELLQPVLQEMADALHQEPIVAIQNVKVFTGSKLRKLLADKKQLECLAEKILEEKANEKGREGRTEMIQAFLETNGIDLGLPPESVSLFYDTLFSQVKNDENKDGFLETLKDILEKFVEQLEASHVYCDIDP